MQSRMNPTKVLLAWQPNAEGVFLMHNSNDADEQLTERELDETLRITARIIEAAAPPESYWPGYHARLKDKLTQAHRTSVAKPARSSWINSIFRASISVPVPVAAALILIFTLPLLLLSRTGEPSVPQIQVVHVPVEVPVVQEKVVTRVVYRQTPQRSRPRITAAQEDSTFARTLDGFKPTEEIKLTVIKGGATNER
jgi:hypothetical protein